MASTPNATGSTTSSRARRCACALARTCGTSIRPELVGDDDPRFALFGEFGDFDVMAAAVIQFESQRLGLENDNDSIYYTFSAGYNLKPHRVQFDVVYMRDRFSGADTGSGRQGRNRATGDVGFQGQEDGQRCCSGAVGVAQAGAGPGAAAGQHWWSARPVGGTRGAAQRPRSRRGGTMTFSRAAAMAYVGSRPGDRAAVCRGASLARADGDPTDTQAARVCGRPLPHQLADRGHRVV